MTEAQTSPTAEKLHEIFASSAPLALRGEWTSPQPDGVERYRLATSGAGIALTRRTDAIFVLTLDLAPETTGASCTVHVTSANGAALATMAVSARQSMRAVVPAGGPGVTQLSVTIEPQVGTPRVRVYGVTARELKIGVASARNGMLLGTHGWYALEAFGGQLFRWVDNDAEVRLLPAFRATRLAIDVEPGPAAGKPMKLVVYDEADRALVQAELRGRDVIDVPVDVRTTKSIRLHVVNGGQHDSSDTRTLNLRVFDVAATD